MRYIKGVARQQRTLFPETVDDYVDKNNPVRFIDAFVDGLNLLELKLKELESFYYNNGIYIDNNFNKNISKVIINYKNKGASNSFIIIMLYFYLIDLVRKTLIEEKAELLGIDRNLYKNEMGFLFKGKKLKF